MAIAKAVTSEIAEFNFEALLQEVAQIKKIIIDAGVHLEDDFVRSQSEKIGKNFVDQVKQNLAARFSDQVSDLSELHKILAEKPLQPDFTSLANSLKVSEAELNSEWKFLQRLPGDLSSQDEMIAFAMDTGKLSMFPVFAKAIRHLLLLPVGTATVERSFSTLNSFKIFSRIEKIGFHVLSHKANNYDFNVLHLMLKKRHFLQLK